ncbi:MAG: sensor domain-containing diguanylate cyclase [Thermodesulforhabdaceae bacterium]
MDDRSVCLDVSQELAALRAVFDSLAEHVAVLDRNGIIVDVNDAWRRFVSANGGDVEKIVGTNYLEVCDTASGRDCDEASRAAHGIREIISGNLKEFYLEYPCHSPMEKRWFLMHVRPWMQDGQIQGAVVSHIPITQRKLAELTLKRYERVISSSPFLISLVDRNYTYLLVNDAYLLYHARKREEIEGHKVQEILGKNAFEKLVKPNLDKCLAGDTVQYEAWFQMAGMGRRYMQVTYYPSREEDGTISGVVVAAYDETRRRILEEEIKRTAELLSEAQELAHVGSFEHNIALGTDFWSDELYRILGYMPNAVAPQFELFFKHIHPDDRDRLLHGMAQGSGEKNPLKLDLRLRTQKGENRWVSVFLVRNRDESGVVTRIHGAVADITERRLAEIRLQEMATTDALTGLANRRRFFELLADEVNRAKRFARPLCVAMLDIDNFKGVNDTYGHSVGDAVLVAVARILRQTLRAVDRAARIGGEEFAVILPETNGLGAVQAMERVRQMVAMSPVTDSHANVSVTLSCGVASWKDGEDGERTLARADAALYAAKGRGKNQVVLA